MSELERLKRRLFKLEPSEQAEINTLCTVMELVGSYEQLLDLPLPALKYILKYFETVNKEIEKQIKKSIR